MRKPRIGFLSLTDCQGCEFVVLQLGEALIDLEKTVDFSSFRLASSRKGSGPYDIFFIDGAVSTEEEEKAMKRLRSESNLLVALGSCATDGGINIIKNHLILEGLNPSKLIYGTEDSETKPFVVPLDAVVAVDLKIPGCPISLDEFRRCLQSLLRGEVPRLKPLELKTVCGDCRSRGVECVTKKGAFCGGPLTLGGCDAPCPAAGVPCFGCRGSLVNPNHADPKHLLLQRVRNGGLSFVWR